MLNPGPWAEHTTFREKKICGLCFEVSDIPLSRVLATPMSYKLHSTKFPVFLYTFILQYYQNSCNLQLESHSLLQ